jgi:hypothetical protein
VSLVDAAFDDKTAHFLQLKGGCESGCGTVTLTRSLKAMPSIFYVARWSSSPSMSR